MKKIILFLLFLATLAVISWYIFPEDTSSPQSSSTILPKNTATKDTAQEVIIEDVPGTWKQPKFLPQEPIADVEDALYEDFSDVVDADIYTLVPQSSLGWVRRDNDIAYPGSLQLSQGKIAVKNSNIVAGLFIFDMNSLALDDPNDTMMDEIKGVNYLDVEQFPEASFILQEVTSDTMSGVLTLKGISKKITFPSLLIMSNDRIRIFSDFSIDKAERGIIPSSPTLSTYLDLHVERILTKL